MKAIRCLIWMWTQFRTIALQEYSPETIARLLRSFDAFQALEDRELESLAELGQVELVPEDHLLIHDNDEGNRLYILLEGALRVFCVKDDMRQIDVAQLGPGAVFGELAVLTQGKRSANVVAEADSTVFYISGDAFKSHASRFTGFSTLIATQMAERLVESTKRIAEAPPIDLFEHLLDILRTSGSSSGLEGREEVLIPSPPSMKRLALELGVSIKEVRAMMAKLEADGVIVSTGGKLILRLVQ